MTCSHDHHPRCPAHVPVADGDLKKNYDLYQFTPCERAKGVFKTFQ